MSLLWFETQLRYELTVWTWASLLIPIHLGFLSCTIWIMVPAKYCCCEEKISYHVLSSVPDSRVVSVVWLSVLLASFLSMRKVKLRLQLVILIGWWPLLHMHFFTKFLLASSFHPAPSCDDAVKPCSHPSSNTDHSAQWALWVLSTDTNTGWLWPFWVPQITNLGGGQPRLRWKVWNCSQEEFLESCKYLMNNSLHVFSFDSYHQIP